MYDKLGSIKFKMCIQSLSYNYLMYLNFVCNKNHYKTIIKNRFI